ncbi:MAG: RNA 3'-phosphate cyclase [Methylothermaceae bacteria B42]|nr:MAG: RNA 3'-phosphate cyclase [Methylothermaceae bacteria B42]HHJ39881.1 RNA 3'-terminal phosphate cyclase [Methylothermaceae bacterium]
MPLRIDGSQGEEGGQILRTSLALSLHLQRPIHLVNIRAKRQKPGLRRQHLACVLAAAELSHAKVTGAHLGSQEILFIPGPIQPGNYRFDIGTAGSTTLLLQAILLPLLLAPSPSHITLCGGTHNPKAPPFDFLERTFLPQLEKMGAHVDLQLERPGFYPQGGGIIHVSINPVCHLQPIDILSRGAIKTIHAKAIVADLPRHIGERELNTLTELIKLKPENCQLQELKGCGVGNVVTVEVINEEITEVFTGYGQRGIRAEKVAQHLATEVQRYLSAEVPVGPYLADQILLPMALAGGGQFLTLPPTRHTLTNIQVIEAFLPLRFDVSKQKQHQWHIRLHPTNTAQS